MADLVKKDLIDQIEIVEVRGYKNIQVRRATVVMEGDVELSRSFHRHVLSPNDSVEGEEPEVQALAALYFTDEAKKAQSEHFAVHRSEMGVDE